MTQRRMIFITGASRSGTTLLSFVLRNHREVFGLKELQYFGQVCDPRAVGRRFSRSEAVDAAATILAVQQRGALAARIEADHRLQGEAVVDALGDTATDPIALFAEVVHRLAQGAGKSIPCEQTPRYIFYARALLNAYPACHVVHIVRDPRAVMASQKMRWQRRKLAADGSAVPRHEALRVWVNYHPYTVARLWSRATGEALALAGHSRVTLVRFEDLVQEPEATIRQLCGSIGLDYDEHMLDVGQINSSHQSSSGGARRGLHADAVDKWKDVLTPAEIAITQRHCRGLMRRFGYLESAEQRAGVFDRLRYRVSYLIHLGGVLLVNPRRAWVQSRALMRSRAGTAPPPGDGQARPPAIR